MMRLVLILLLALGVCALPMAARADTPTITVTGTFTTVSTNGFVALSGQSTCAVVLSGTGAGMTIVPQGSSDGGTTWTTASTINAGSMTANGAYTGNITGVGLTAFRLNVTAISSGTETYTITCSGALAAASITAAGNLPVAIASPVAASGAIQVTVCDKTTNAQCGAVNASGQQSIAGPLTGASGTGTASGAGQMLVAGCNYTTSPTAITTTQVGPIQCSALGAPFVLNYATYPGGGSGGGCSGFVGGAGNVNIVKRILSQNLTASTASTQLVALSASTFVHICHIDISGVLSTAGAVNIITGTGTNCATGLATIWTYIAPVSTAGFLFNAGDGDHSLFDNSASGASGNALCYSTGAFVSTTTPVMNITYAQY